MLFTKTHIAVLLFNLIYIVGFGAYYIAIQDFEFLWYVAVLVFFFLLIALTLKRSQFSPLILWGLSVWGLLHMAGGGIPAGGSVLYALPLIPIWQIDDSIILKYDQLVHFWGFFVSTLVVFHLLRPYLNERANWVVISGIAIAAGAGLGALNEIVEFIAVLSFPETGVGGYTNTALDLVFNTLGAITAAIVVHLKRRRVVEYSHTS